MDGWMLSNIWKFGSNKLVPIITSQQLETVIPSPASLFSLIVRPRSDTSPWQGTVHHACFGGGGKKPERFPGKEPGKAKMCLRGYI